ncbi:HCNGP-like protein-domain-containing protein [Camillea tinctor]|nr:HCNGP-like protein-domain-containing protein [Camillea tinctor]
MALVGYESSDEEEEVVAPVAEPKSLKPVEGETNKAGEQPNTEKTSPKATITEEVVGQKPAPVYGPQMGPASGPSFPPLEEADDLPEPEASASASSAPELPPGSPYSATRALLRDLTLPSVPNMDIPPSPRGVSPPPATSRKFEHFLELKRKGVHFNSRIAESASMRNPALADKMLAYAGLDSPRDQYRTTLPPDLWDPADAFPRHAFREQLRKSQLEVAQTRAREKGAPVEFVAAASTSATGSSGGGQGGGGGGVQPSAKKRKTRFDA